MFNELTLALYASGLSSESLPFYHHVDLGDDSYWVTISDVDFKGGCTINGILWNATTCGNDTIDNELKTAFERLQQLLG